MIQEKHEYCLQKMDDLALTFSSWTDELLAESQTALDSGNYNDAIKLASEAQGTNRAHKEIARMLSELADDMGVDA